MEKSLCLGYRAATDISFEHFLKDLGGFIGVRITTLRVISVDLEKVFIRVSWKVLCGCSKSILPDPFVQAVPSCMISLVCIADSWDFFCVYGLDSATAALCH